jgi:serine protease 16
MLQTLQESGKKKLTLCHALCFNIARLAKESNRNKVFCFLLCFNFSGHRSLIEGNPIPRVMKVALLLVAVLCAVVSVQANTQLFKERFRHGALYRQAVEREEAHHAQLGFSPNTTASYFYPPVDHNNASLGTFKDKFYYDTTFWNGSVCIFYLNGEAPLSHAVGGYMAEIAQAFGACTVSIEHRWYGESLPAPLTNKQLLTSTLSVYQAMHDVKALKEYFETTIAKRNLTWILIGGSYSGACTVWANQMFPGMFKASWAASGVVKATFSFTDYDGHVQAVATAECTDALKRIMFVAHKKWFESADSEARIRTMFNLLPADQQTFTDFMEGMASAYQGAVQYSAKTVVCNSVTPLAEGDWEILAQYQNYSFGMWGPNFFGNCGSSRACLSNVSESSQWGAAGYSWLWQTCNEMAFWQIGYPNSIASENITVSYFIDYCRAAFYPKTLPDTFSFNDRYHGLNPITKGNIIATQGSDDPWSTTGLKTSLAANFPVTTAECNDCGHCGSMMSPHPTDPANLVAQRAEVMSYLSQWMAQDQSDKESKLGLFIGIPVATVVVLATIFAIYKKKVSAGTHDVDEKLIQ